MTRKTKMKGFGHINTSNVDSRSECITLTYSLKDVGTIDDAKNTIKKLDKLHHNNATCDISIADFGTKDEMLNIKYKIKACEGEGLARDIKSAIDLYLAKHGGQTTLDEGK